MDDISEVQIPADIPESAVEEVGDIGEQVEVDAETDFALDTELQVQDAIESLQQMENLDPQTWQSLEATERLEVLQNIEDQMADIQGRPAVDIVASEMDVGTFGYYDGQGIKISSADLAGDMPIEEFINTIVHEGRHAYQEYAVQNPGFVTDSTTVALWGENMEPGNYFFAEDYGQEIYQSQPIEVDAWRYADRITNALIAKGVEK